MGYPRGNSTSIAYTATTKTATRGPLVETTTFDGFGRPASISLGGVVTKYTYDYRGRVTFKSNPGSTIGTTYQYDALDRLTKVIYAGLPPAMPEWQNERDKKNKFLHWLRSNGFRRRCFSAC